MKTAEKINRRGYGNRPFKNYQGVTILTENISSIPKIKYDIKLSWYRRLINWFKKI